MPEIWSNAYNETDRQLVLADGVLTALEEVMEAVPGLNGSDPRVNSLFALVAVLKGHLVKVRECHDAEWDARKPAQSVGTAEQGSKHLRDALDLWDTWRALPAEKRQAAVAHLQNMANAESQSATAGKVEGRQ